MAAAGTAVRGLLEGPVRTLSVVAPTPRASYVGQAGGDVVLALLAPSAVRVPIGVVLPFLPALAPGTPVVAGEGAVVVDGVRHPVLRWSDTAVPHLVRRPAPGTGTALTALLDCLVTRVGEGPGLTPEADDVLAGGLAALHALGADEVLAALREPVVAACRRTTPVSAALLRCALDGHAVAPVQALLRALAAGDAVRRRGALEALGRVGHTSGPALARGVRVVWARAGRPAEREVA